MNWLNTTGIIGTIIKAVKDIQTMKYRGEYLMFDGEVSDAYELACGEPEAERIFTMMEFAEMQVGITDIRRFDYGGDNARYEVRYTNNNEAHYYQLFRGDEPVTFFVPKEIVMRDGFTRRYIVSSGVPESEMR